VVVRDIFVVGDEVAVHDLFVVEVSQWTEEEGTAADAR